MALINPADLTAQARGFNGLPVLRQIGLMIGLAASVALGVAVVLWSQAPGRTQLYGNLADAEAAQVIEALDRAGIDYKLEERTGAITVARSQVHEARLKLATMGLPKGGESGFELLEKNQGFGTSRFMEQARYRQALEGELARSIATIQSVRSARVHLAIPKNSVFVRDKVKPRASVVLNLYSGTRLNDTGLAGIVHLVAASIPELDADQVTVVDQKGRLLTDNQSFREIGLSAGQLTYSRQLEGLYVKRIRDILTPIVGEGGVRAQVVAELDFTVIEKTAESFAPENAAVRSEETFEEQTAGTSNGGVPGALSNQPPPAGVTEPAAVEKVKDSPMNSSRRATRNYELDRSITHTRSAPGTVRRLSVAVVVDDHTSINDEGDIERVPLDAEELARLTALVKEAVGFDEKRNDSVIVSNISFKTAEEVEPIPDPPVWKQAWLWDVVKQGFGVLLVLLLAFGVLRPVLRNLVAKAPPALPDRRSAGQLPSGDDQLSLSNQQLAGPGQQQQQFGMARSMIDNDPKQVAQVVKSWVASDG